ncbi:MAG: Crp/Fnr family transcriptional regulator [Chloroflexi bacterium]|nr:Crp/Fnr family transcriptional regulator [Chloroflexota bacterium]
MRSIRLLAPLDDHEIESLARVSHRSTYQMGEVIAASWTKRAELVGLVEGEGRLYRSRADGREKTLTTVSAGALVGLPFLAAGARPRGVLEAVRKRIIAWHIPARHFRALLRRNADLALAVVDELCRRLEEADADREASGSRDIPGHLAGALLRLAELRAGRLVVSETQAKLAARVGSSRDYVARVLGQFQEDGLIASRRGRAGLAILDVDGLKAIADPPPSAGEGRESP